MTSLTSLSWNFHPYYPRLLTTPVCFVPESYSVDRILPGRLGAQENLLDQLHLHVSRHTAALPPLRPLCEGLTADLPHLPLLADLLLHYERSELGSALNTGLTFLVIQFDLKGNKISFTIFSSRLSSPVSASQW